MQVVHGFDEPEAYRGGFVSIGNFDGVHRGHRRMLAALLANAHQHKSRAVVFTFDPHPIVLLRPQHAPPPLATTERKLELFEDCGIDTVIVYPTDDALLHLTASEFFTQIVQGKLAAKGLVEGPNFFFGKDRAGTIDVLRGFCGTTGLELEIIEPVIHNGLLVSSSTIRNLIRDGKVAEAGELLGERYRIRGNVVRGAARGRTIGFPTANLAEIPTLLPPDGVYAGLCRKSEKVYTAGINIGSNPTFGESQRKVEVHLDGFSGDLYGQLLEVEFLARLRDARTFAGISELQSQLRQDMEQSRALAAAAQSE